MEDGRDFRLPERITEEGLGGPLVKTLSDHRWDRRYDEVTGFNPTSRNGQRLAWASLRFTLEEREDLLGSLAREKARAATADTAEKVVKAAVDIQEMRERNFGTDLALSMLWEAVREYRAAVMKAA